MNELLESFFFGLGVLGVLVAITLGLCFLIGPENLFIGCFGLILVIGITAFGSAIRS